MIQKSKIQKSKSITPKKAAIAAKRPRRSMNPISFPESRGTISMWLAFIQKLIPKISELIQSESPEASLKIPKTTRCPSVKQINESRNNIAGFASLAIPLVIKYQASLNTLVSKLEDASKTRLTMKGFFPNPNEIDKDSLENIKVIIKKILNQENQLEQSEDILQKLPAEIDDLIANFINQWQEHEQKFAETLIQELEAELGALSDSEKMAILNKTKTISEIRNALKKAGLDLGEIKTLGTITNFKLRAMDAIVAKLSNQFKQDTITTTNMAKIFNGIKSITDEKNAASNISEKQKGEYKNLNTKIKDCVKSMEKLTLAKDRQLLVTLFNTHQAAMKKIAALEKTTQETLEYDD